MFNVFVEVLVDIMEEIGIQFFIVIFNICWFDFEVDVELYWVDYDVEFYFIDCVFDVLYKIKWEVDGLFIFWCFCVYGICGFDVMCINGCNCLVCKMLIKDFDILKLIYVEVIKGLLLEKDFVVDMELFFVFYCEVQLFFVVNFVLEKGKECMQFIVDCEIFDDIIKCIFCVVCILLCFVFWIDGQYFGLVVIVNVYCFIFDLCDDNVVVCLDIFNDKEGVWCCCMIFNCFEVCFCGIEVIKVIVEVKQVVFCGCF